jgi:phosphatidylglycerophosphate synthase
VKPNSANICTVLGALLGICGVALWNPYLLLLSWAADVLDGFLARHYNCVTKEGAQLDFSVDCMLGGAIAAHVSPILLLPCFLGICFTAVANTRVSGRSLMTLVACYTIWSR